MGRTTVHVIDTSAHLTQWPIDVSDLVSNGGRKKVYPSRCQIGGPEQTSNILPSV